MAGRLFGGGSKKKEQEQRLSAVMARREARRQESGGGGGNDAAAPAGLAGAAAKRKPREAGQAPRSRAAPQGKQPMAGRSQAPAPSQQPPPPQQQPRQAAPATGAPGSRRSGQPRGGLQAPSGGAGGGGSGAGSGFFKRGLRRMVGLKDAAAGSAAPAASQPADATTLKRSGPAPQGLMELGGGTLACCPLQNDDYTQAWEQEEAHRGKPKRSRLYGTLQEVLSDPAALEFFVQFMNKRKALNWLKLWTACFKFSNKCPESPQERLQMAAGMFERFAAPNAKSPVKLPEPIVQALETDLKAEGGTLASTCFDATLRHVNEVLEQDYFPQFHRSAHYYQYAMRILTSRAVRVDDILLNENTMGCFMEYLDREGTSRLLQFWLMADNFEKQMAGDPVEGDKLTPDQARGDAMGLYNQFFSLQAPVPMRLGVDEATRVAIESNICREEGPTAKCFSRAQHLVYTAFKLYFFPNFQQSDLYYQFLNDLVKASQDGPESTPETSRTTSPTPDEADSAEGDLEADAGPAVGDYALGLITPWGVYKRDAQVARETGEFLVGAVKRTASWFSSKKEIQDERMALQVTMMIISDLYTEMKNCGTFEVGYDEDALEFLGEDEPRLRERRKQALARRGTSDEFWRHHQPPSKVEPANAI